MKSKSASRPRVVLVNRCFVINDTGQFLVMQRSANDSHHPGLWEVPGGKLDEGQDLTHALEREVLEETNLVINPVSPLVFADSEIIAKGPYKGLSYIVIFSIGRVMGGTVRLSAEHDAYKWVTYSEAEVLDLTPEVRKALLVLSKQLQK